MRSGFYTRHAKRWLDLVLALTVLLVLSPLLLLTALAVKLDSRGPVFYRQERAGRDGRIFRIFKFRSMTVGAEHVGAGIRVEKDDARITRVGKLLRRTSIDEIPQLLNVVTGDMSVIGPRPGLPYQAEQYTEAQRRRLLVRPGITGWAQVNGRNAVDWGRRIELDLEYLGRISAATDLTILLRTIPAVFAGSDMIAAKEHWKKPAGQVDGGDSREPGAEAPRTERTGGDAHG